MVPTQQSGTAVDVSKPAGPVTPDVQETEIGATQGKPSLLYFYWPNPEDPAGDACKALDEKVWVDGKVRELAQQFICIKVNGKTCPKQVLMTFGIASYPTIVFETCNKNVVSRIRSKCVDPKAFAGAMQSVVRTNEKLVELRKAREARLDLLVEAAAKLLERGDLKRAESTYRKLLDLAKDSPDSPQAGLAQAGLTEIGCRRDLAKGEAFLAKEQYAEAQSFLQMAADCAVPCTARDTARELLPDCRFGRLYAAACAKLKAGDNVGALEGFTKIAGDTCYEGKFKALASTKLQEMKDAWNNKAN